MVVIIWKTLPPGFNFWFIERFGWSLPVWFAQYVCFVVFWLNHSHCISLDWCCSSSRRKVVDFAPPAARFWSTFRRAAKGFERVARRTVGMERYCYINTLGFSVAQVETFAFPNFLFPAFFLFRFILRMLLSVLAALLYYAAAEFSSIWFDSKWEFFI